MLGCVGRRRAEPRTDGCRCPGAKRSAAAPAELLAELVREAAGRTRECQRSATLRAEAAPLAVVVLAPGTLHAGASMQPRPSRSERQAESNCSRLAWSRPPPPEHSGDPVRARAEI